MKEWVNLLQTDRTERGMLTDLSQLQCPELYDDLRSVSPNAIKSTRAGNHQKAHVFAAVVQREGDAAKSEAWKNWKMSPQPKSAE